MATNPYQSPQSSDKPSARRAKWYQPKPSRWRYVMWLGVLAVGAAILAMNLLMQYQAYRISVDR
jgi:hypothetical protein